MEKEALMQTPDLIAHVCAYADRQATAKINSERFCVIPAIHQFVKNCQALLVKEFQSHEILNL